MSRGQCSAPSGEEDRAKTAFDLCRRIIKCFLAAVSSMRRTREIL